MRRIAVIFDLFERLVDDFCMRLLEGVRPGGIVLAGDGTSRSRIKDVEAKSLIIEGWRGQGYRFVTVSELVGEVRNVG